jgi:hypothetical protein
MIERGGCRVGQVPEAVRRYDPQIEILIFITAETSHKKVAS